MSITSDFVRWQAGCTDGGGFGITHSDTLYCGYRSYTQPYPCPNGLAARQLEFEEIQKLEPYKRRMEKAKRDIETHTTEHRVRALAESFNHDEILHDLKEIQTWARSLQKPEISHNGWTRSTPPEVA